MPRRAALSGTSIMLSNGKAKEPTPVAQERPARIRRPRELKRAVLGGHADRRLLKRSHHALVSIFLLLISEAVPTERSATARL
jgi:hypothetical protein